MSQDKELEIQLQFLDEAQEYLGTLDAALLGLASRGVDIDQINAALRAAHSIKGGAGMMRFETLSHLAHRLEDSFKVLKVQKHAIDLDVELEQLLLLGVDCLRQVIDWNRQGITIDTDWLETQVSPTFERLHERLGEPETEDAHSILSPEEGQDVIALLFQTEVEGCLQRLDDALAAHDPCLREEVDILAQELGGLGEMLQLSAFTQLCESVAQHLAAAPDRTEDVAQLALEAWRRSQALVLSGNLDLLPSAIEGASFDVVASQTDADAFGITQPDITQPDLTEASDLFEATWAVAVDGIEPDWADQALDWTDADRAASVANTEADTTNFTSPDFASDDNLSANINAPSDAAVNGEPIPLSSASVPVANTRIEPSSEFRISDVQPEASSQPGREPQENSVRVPIKQLDVLNDLLGELTIERNGLDLNLKRLRNLVHTLSHRIQVLEHSNSQLRDAYDKVATQTGAPPASNFLLPAAIHPATIAGDSDNSVKSINNRFDVLEMDRYNDLHSLSQEVMETIVQIQEVTSDIELGLDDTEQTTRELNKTAGQVQNKLTQVRMRPLSDITDRFPRAIRELSLQYDKPVELRVHGANTLIDRNILEALSDPLLHLLRNAFDHGIEETETRQTRGKSEHGLIEIQAMQRNNRIIITVSDDGGGIPLDKIRTRARQMGLDEVLLAAASDEELLSLIFEPGFSTSDRVTALSGRGVGMDVVRERLKQIHGEVKVNTQSGSGTTFTLSVPFTLSVTRVLIAESHNMLMAFPIDAIEEMLTLQPDQVMTTAGSEAFNWNGTMAQLIRLSQWLEFRRPYQPDRLDSNAAIDVPTVLMLSQGNQLVGLQVDRCWGEQEAAIRKVEGGLPLPPGFNNCTILGDGRVVPLVNVSELLHWINSYERSKATAPPADESLPTLPPVTSASPNAPFERQPTILIVDDSINVRRFLALTLEKAGYQVAQAKDGQDALDKLAAGLQVQAVICDIEMPRLDGYGFLSRVKATPVLAQIPVAMLTSRSGDKHRQLAMNLGAIAYFSKPYNEQMLLQTLETMVGLTPAL
jgi:chemosensory pili system protein ChpA (sensor histidine kinase/response regulator)